MPRDEDLLSEHLERYEQIIHELQGVREERCLAPLINSFGYGDAFGLYWSTLHLIEKYDQRTVQPLLLSALSSSHPGVRMWSAYMAGRTRNAVFVEELLPQMTDTEEMVRANAVKALGMIGDPSALERIRALLDDPSDTVRDNAEEAVRDLLGN